MKRKSVAMLAALAAIQCAGPLSAAGQAPASAAPRVVFDAKSLSKDAGEARILDVIRDVFATQRRGSMSVPEEDGRILRLLTESLGAKRVVEIGTSVGYSGLWFCLALRTTGGGLTTYEIDPGRAETARANFKRAGVDAMVTLIEGDAHAEAAKWSGPIDLLFLDADKEGYIDYLEKLLPHVRPGGLIVAHNMNQRMAHPPYIEAITSNPALETVFINMETSGIGITMKKR